MSDDVKKLLAKASPNDPDSLRALCRALMREGYGAPRVRAFGETRRAGYGPFISDWTADEPKARELASGMARDWQNFLRVRLEWEDGRRETLEVARPPTYDARDITVRFGDPVVEPARISGHIALDDDPDQVIAPGAFNVPEALVATAEREDGRTLFDQVRDAVLAALEPHGLRVESLHATTAQATPGERLWSWRWRSSGGQTHHRQICVSLTQPPWLTAAAIVNSVLEEESDHE